MVFRSDPFQRLTAGGTFSRAFQILTSRYDLFFSIACFIFVPQLVLQITLSHSTGSSFQTMNAFLNQNMAAASYDAPTDLNDAQKEAVADALVPDMMKVSAQVAMEYIILMVFAVAGNAAMCHAVAELYADRYPTWLASLRKGFSRWCDVFGATMLFSVGLSLGYLVCVVGIFILSMLMPGWVVALFGFLVAVVFLVFACYISVSLMILQPVIMVEGKGPIDSIKRCWELSSNNRCYIYCTSFCLALTSIVVQSVLFLMLSAAAGGTEGVHLGWAAFVMSLPTMVYAPLSSMYVYNK
jgi:hypothetical protein